MITKYTLKNRNIIEVSDDTANIFIYTKPNENDLLLLKHEFNLDDYDIASVVDQDEVPRIEMLEKRLLIIWKNSSISNGDRFS